MRRSSVRRGKSMNAGKVWYWSTVAHRHGFVRVGKLLKLANFMMFRNLLPPEAILEPDITLEHYGLCAVVLLPRR